MWDLVVAVLDLPFPISSGIISLFVLVCIRIYCTLTVGICKSTNRLTGKTVIVTGANSGIGKEAALDLAGRGARVILACRNVKLASQVKDEIISQTGNQDVLVRDLDLASLKSVRKFAADILQAESKIDILVNNAGCATTETKFTEDGLEYQMQSNYFSHFLLTHLLLGKMLQTEGSRIINVSSVGHKFYKLNLANINFKDSKAKPLEIYTISKLCQILFTRELAKRIRATGKSTTVNVLHPGVIRTGISRDLDFFIGFGFNKFPGSFYCKSMKEGAQTTIHLAVSDEVANISGEYFSDCKLSTPSRQAQDDALAKKLWEVTEELVGLKPEELHC